VGVIECHPHRQIRAAAGMSNTAAAQGEPLVHVEARSVVDAIAVVDVLTTWGPVLAVLFWVLVAILITWFVLRRRRGTRRRQA